LEVVFLENEDYTGEFVTLDTSIWLPVLQERGTNKGKNPVVSPNGTIYIGREFAGVEVRAFRKVQKKEE
jgi:hypothetical protein